MSVFQIIGLVDAISPLTGFYVSGSVFLFTMLICWGVTQFVWLRLLVHLRSKHIPFGSPFFAVGSLIGAAGALVSAATLLTIAAIGERDWCVVFAKLALAVAVPTSTIAQSIFIASLEDVLSSNPSTLVRLANVAAVIASLAVAAAILILAPYTAVLLPFTTTPAFAIGAIRSLRVRRMLNAHTRRVG